MTADRTLLITWITVGFDMFFPDKNIKIIVVDCILSNDYIQADYHY